MMEKEIEKLLRKRFNFSDEDKYSDELRELYDKKLSKHGDAKIKRVASRMVKDNRSASIFCLWLRYVTIWGVF